MTSLMQSPATPFLQVDIGVPRQAFEVQAAFTAEQGEIVALLGPNGSGKSTVLQVLAGLLEPTRADIRLAGRTIADRHRTLAPNRRRIGLMSQDPLVFPHLTALENVAFGPRSQGVPKAQARERAAEWLQRLDLARYLGSRPAELSGGQRQRVALARALAAEPDLLLLDEPLAAADVRTAGEIRQLLLEHLRAAGQTTVLVTHEVLDAAVLADTVLVLQSGQVVERGDTRTMLTEPRTAFGAALAGLNLVPGTAIAATRIRTDDGIEVAGIAERPAGTGVAVAAVFTPSAVALYADQVAGSPRNHWPGRVTAIEPGAAAVRVRVELESRGSTGQPARPADAAPNTTAGTVTAGTDGTAGTVTAGTAGTAGTATTVAADITPAAVADLAIELGSRVYVDVKATQVRLFPR